MRRLVAFHDCGSTHVCPAAAEVRQGAHLQDILRLLTLWFNHGSAPDVEAALEEGFTHVSIDTWLAVIPQVSICFHQEIQKYYQSTSKALAAESHSATEGTTESHRALCRLLFGAYIWRPPAALQQPEAQKLEFCTMRFRSSIKVLAKPMLKHCRNHKVYCICVEQHGI